MADEVNTFAFEGGDTAEGTKEQIQQRNESLQKYVDKSNEISKKLDEAKREAYDAAMEAEQQAHEDLGEAAVTGEAVSPSDKAKSESKKSE